MFARKLQTWHCRYINLKKKNLRKKQSGKAKPTQKKNKSKTESGWFLFHVLHPPGLAYREHAHTRDGTKTASTKPLIFGLFWGVDFLLFSLHKPTYSSKRFEHSSISRYRKTPPIFAPALDGTLDSGGVSRWRSRVVDGTFLKEWKLQKNRPLWSVLIFCV